MAAAHAARGAWGLVHRRPSIACATRSWQVTMPETSQIGREIGAAPLDHRPPAPFARDALPSGCAGGSRHKPALNVSAPADIQGGDAVADERPSGVSDALSVRTEGTRIGSRVWAMTRQGSSRSSNVAPMQYRRIGPTRWVIRSQPSSVLSGEPQFPICAAFDGERHGFPRCLGRYNESVLTLRQQR